jgi:hypothetical protein
MTSDDKPLTRPRLARSSRGVWVTHGSHEKKPIDPRFRVGERVRVRPGIWDQVFAVIPLGRWLGTVTEIINEQGQTAESLSRMNCSSRTCPTSNIWRPCSLET